MNKKIKKIKLPSRAKVRFTEEEMIQLEAYLKENPAGYKTVQINTGISYPTICRIKQNKWAELATAIRLRDFLKALKELA